MSDDAHSELTEDEAMAGGIVWVCEHGHTDPAHKTADNYIDLCSRCKNGVCTPVKTLGRRSKAQREIDRELGIDTPHRRRQKRRSPVPDEIRAVARDGSSRLVDAAELQQEEVVAFELSPADRAAILAGKLPRLTFPRTPPADRSEDQPYPAAVGDAIAVAAGVVLVVTGDRMLIDEIVLEYEVRDFRSQTGGDARMVTSKEPDKPGERMGGPEFRAEREPERLPRREAAKIADRVRESELRRLRRLRAEVGEQLKAEATGPRDIRFHLGKTIEGIDRRIANIEAEMKGQAA